MVDYVCTTCGAVFQEEPSYDAAHGCIYCGCDVEKAETCSKCGATIPYSQSKFGLCEDCEKQLLRHFKLFLGGVEAMFGPGGVEYLEERQDGEFWKEWRTWK